MNISVLHLIGGSTAGGAARAALELHDALIAVGIDSRAIQSHGRPIVPGTLSLEAGNFSKASRFIRTAADRGLSNFGRRAGDGRGFSVGLFGAPISYFAKQADILHLHWINDGGFRLPRLQSLPANSVWTFHDLWPMTAGCHYAFDCRAFETGCSAACPALGKHFPVASTLQRIKARAASGGVQGVAVSQWLANEAEKSKVFAGRGVISIPNLVDTNDFWPVDKSVARRALGLQPGRPILLTGHASSSYQKGADLLAEAIAGMRARGVDFDLIGFGNADEALAKSYTRHFGYSGDVTTLRLLYSAADVFAFPSRTEAFGRTIVEAFACGTPVVAFAGSGPDDIITPDVGILAPPGDVDSFASGLVHLLGQSKRYATACRNRAEAVYAKPVVANQYAALYQSILDKLT